MPYIQRISDDVINFIMALNRICDILSHYQILFQLTFKQWTPYHFGLKYTSFSTWFDGSRIQICCVKTIIVTSIKNGWSFACSLFAKFNFSVILLVVKDKRYSRNTCILFCSPTQARQHFHDVLCWHLIFLLHPMNI